MTHDYYTSCVTFANAGKGNTARWIKCSIFLYDRHIRHVKQSVKCAGESKIGSDLTATLAVTLRTHCGFNNEGSFIENINVQFYYKSSFKQKIWRKILQPEENTCSLFMPRKSLRSSVKGSRLLSSRIRFSARCSSSRTFWAMKELSARALIRFLSNTSSLSWWSPSNPSTWLISFPRKSRLYQDNKESQQKSWTYVNKQTNKKIHVHTLKNMNGNILKQYKHLSGVCLCASWC